MQKHRFFTRNAMIVGFGLIGLNSVLAPRLLAASNPLRSQQGIDYAPLQQLLQAGKWQDANELTSVLVLKAAAQERQGYLRASDTRRLACSDLQIVDRLWKTASNGRFGLSVQANIWRNLKGVNYEDSLRFQKQVGWNSALFPVSDPSQVPVGHLPFRPAGRTGVMDAFGGWWIREMPLRLQQCNIR